jgi:NAD dependent epimerase/dehydratase family
MLANHHEFTGRAHSRHLKYRKNHGATDDRGPITPSPRVFQRAILRLRGGRLPMARTPFELKGKTVFVAGHRGMVGSALVRRLVQEDVELLTGVRREIDLRDQAAVSGWFAAKRPAGRVSGGGKPATPKSRSAAAASQKGGKAWARQLCALFTKTSNL